MTETMDLRNLKNIPKSLIDKNGYIINESFYKFFELLKEEYTHLEINKPKDYYSCLKEINNLIDEDINILEKWKDYLKKCLKEGRKEVYIYPINVTDESIFNDNQITELIKQFDWAELDCLKEGSSIVDRILGESDFEYYLKEFHLNETNKTLSLSFSRMITIYVENNQGDVTTNEKEVYPIFLDVHYKKGKEYIIIRVNNKDNMYNTKDRGKESKRITTMNQVDFLKSKVMESLKLAKPDKTTLKNISDQSRKQLFEILDELSQTPKYIKDEISSNKNNIDNFANIIYNYLKELENIYPVEEKISEDIELLLEKHMLINHLDINSLTENMKNGYAVSLTSNDLDSSKLKGKTKDNKTPLITKTIYYNNKNSIYSVKECKELTVMLPRKGIGNNELYSVGYSIKKDYILVKFFSYTAEEDISHACKKITGKIIR